MIRFENLRTFLDLSVKTAMTAELIDEHAALVTHPLEETSVAQTHLRPLDLLQAGWVLLVKVVTCDWTRTNLFLWSTGGTLDVVGVVQPILGRILRMTGTRRNLLIYFILVRFNVTYTLVSLVLVDLTSGSMKRLILTIF